MAGRYNGYHTIRREEIEGYLRFEVFWQNAGWFWRPLFQLDGEAVGPFTTSSQAYQSAVTADESVARPRRAGVGRPLTRSRTGGHSLSVDPAIRAESVSLSESIRASFRPRAQRDGGLTQPDDHENGRRLKSTL